jgi:SNF2 family DNA or RNA helicase
MGLGKTVMSLALIDTHVEKQKKNPQKEAGTLIIVPTVVLTQWQTKVNEFLPHLNCLIISQGKNVKKE